MDSQKKNKMLSCSLCGKSITQAVNLSNGRAVHKKCLNSAQKEYDKKVWELYSLELEIKKQSDRLKNRKKISSKIISIFRPSREHSDIIQTRLVQLRNEELLEKGKLTGLNKLLSPIYDYFLDYPPDWDERRLQALKRDGDKCTNCRNTDNLHIHHIIPLSKGGSNLLINLEILCEDCHSEEHGGREFSYTYKNKTESHFSKKISAIKSAINTSNKLEFYYKKPSDKKSIKRVIIPEEVITKKHRNGDEKTLCVKGFCELRKAKRVFAVKRISRLQIIGSQ